MLRIQINTFRECGINKGDPKPFSLMLHDASQPIMIEWGDGCSSLIKPGTPNKYLPLDSQGYSYADHTYHKDGVYIIEVRTGFGNFKLGDSRHIFGAADYPADEYYDCRLLVEKILEWDSPDIYSMHRSLTGCSNLISVPASLPINVVNIRRMFDGCSDYFLGNDDVAKWDTSRVYDMSGAFRGCRCLTADLSNWSVGDAEDMSNMFQGCCNFNSDISGWDVRNVIDFSFMFDGAETFNADISKWRINLLSNTKNMFSKGSDGYRDTHNKYYTLPVNIKGWADGV